MKITPLPPLNSLVAFEAAARLLSFTLAGTELNVTQGAISRQVHNLEDYIGYPLFVRKNRTISLTTIGSTYYCSVSLNLQNIAQSTAEIKKSKSARQLTVTTSSAMATLWLLPKVAQFQKDHDINLQILTIDHTVDYQNIDSDFCLFYCRNPPTDMRVTKLFNEKVFPVCSPEYLANITPFTDEKELFSNSLLSLDESQYDWLTWSQWFKQVELPPIALNTKVSINSYSMLLQAAINSQGIALGWAALVDDYLNEGTLVKPSKYVLNTSATFCLIEPKYSNKRHKDIKAFRDMLLGYVEVGE